MNDVSASDVRGRLAVVREIVGPDVLVVAVTKGFPVSVVDAVIGAGITDLGENYAQELVEKAEASDATSPPIRWHAIGRLQRNKLRSLAPHVSLWHTLDRAELIDALASRVSGAHVLVQVNVSGETTKGGCDPADTGPLVDRARDVGLDVRGLTTIAPAGGGPRASRCFSALRDLRDRLGLAELSMGMSDDLIEAVAEGATIVRVGTALLGPRPRRT